MCKKNVVWFHFHWLASSTLNISKPNHINLHSVLPDDPQRSLHSPHSASKELGIRVHRLCSFIAVTMASPTENHRRAVYTCASHSYSLLQWTNPSYLNRSLAGPNSRKRIWNDTVLVTHTHARTRTHTHTHIYILVYMYILVRFLLLTHSDGPIWPDWSWMVLF